MNFIVAVSEDYGIGKDNRLLFKLSKDLQFFKEKTLNKVVVMGRKTYESLPVKPLKNRINIVLTSDENFFEQGVKVVHSYDELFKEIENYNQENVFLIGGANLYNKLIDRCHKGYVTKIYKKVEADTYIKNIETDKNWKEINSSKPYLQNDLEFEFKEFENLNYKVF